MAAKLRVTPRRQEPSRAEPRTLRRFWLPAVLLLAMPPAA